MNWLKKILAAALHVVVSPSLGGTRAANPPTPKKQKVYTRAQLAKELEPGLNVLFGAEYAKYENKKIIHPRYCDTLLRRLQARPYTLSELESVLTKKRSTLYHEMSELRKAGYKVKKSYDKQNSEYKYMIV